MRRLALLLAALGLLSLLVVAYASSGRATTTRGRDDAPRCTNATYRGQYGFIFDGNFNFSGEPGKNLPAVFSGVLAFDGRGTARGVLYGNPPGTEAPDGNAEGAPFVFRYQVRPDCTGFGRNFFNGAPASALAFVLTDIRDDVAQVVLLNDMLPGVYATIRHERIVRSVQD